MVWCSYLPFFPRLLFLILLASSVRPLNRRCEDCAVSFEENDSASNRFFQPSNRYVGTNTYPLNNNVYPSTSVSSLGAYGFRDYASSSLSGIDGYASSPYTGTGSNGYASSPYTGTGINGYVSSPYTGTGINGYVSSPYTGTGINGYASPYTGYNGYRQNQGVRWSIGNYEITGYLRESSIGGYNSDGYINPESRPRCPLPNYDTLRRPSSSSYYGPSRLFYSRQHREGQRRRVLENEFEIEIQDSYEQPEQQEEIGPNDTEGRWFFGLKPFRQSLPNNYVPRPGLGGLPSAPSGGCGGCLWEAELVCQLSARGEDVRWTRYHDNAFYPRGRYHDILDYFGSRARIDTVEDGSLSKLIIYQVLPGDKGRYACETWNWGERGNQPNGYGQDAQKEVLTIDFYPQFPLLGAC